MKTHIALSTLKASIHCMAKKDTRYYLCGVLFSFKHGEVPRIEVVSTDGAIMSAFSDKLEYFDNPQTSDFEFIIPDSAISLAIKGAGKRTFLTIESLPDGRYALGDSIFSPIDGKFPDYRRVIPKTDKPQSEKPLQFDAELLLKAQKAMQDYWTTKKLFTVEHKDDVAVMHNGTNQALLIVTPIRDNAYSYQGFYAVQPLVLAARN